MYQGNSIHGILSVLIFIDISTFINLGHIYNPILGESERYGKNSDSINRALGKTKHFVLKVVANISQL